jgi:hypothetical protein
MKNKIWEEKEEMKKCSEKRNIKEYLRFEVFTEVTMKNSVLWDVTLRGFCKNRRFGGT